MHNAHKKNIYTNSKNGADEKMDFQNCSYLNGSLAPNGNTFQLFHTCQITLVVDPAD